MQASSTTEEVGRQRIAAAFQQYASAQRAIRDSTVFFLESADHLVDVLRFAEHLDIVFAPAGSAARTDPRIIYYDGALVVPGDVMVVDRDYVVEAQDYRNIAASSFVGYTLVRQGSAQGLAGFFRDADAARESGVFVDELLRDTVRLDSLDAFRASDPDPDPESESESDADSGSDADSLVRVHVTAAGEYRDGSDGLLLGHCGHERADIEVVAAENAGRGRSFARIVDPRVLEADLDDRPWIERYVATLDLLWPQKEFAAAGHEVCTCRGVS